jgi:hypothetical protein
MRTPGEVGTGKRRHLGESDWPATQTEMTGDDGGRTKTAAERKENFGSKHELQRAVDALNLGSDTMLRISNLYSREVKGHNI